MIQFRRTSPGLAACAALMLTGVTALRARAAVELKVGGAAAAPIFAGAGKHELRFRVVAAAERVSLQVEARDLATGKTVARATRKVVLRSGEQTCAVPLRLARLGFYRATLSALGGDGRVLASAATSLAVVPNRTAVGPADFGVCTHFAQNKGALPQSLELIRLAGFARIRDELPWDTVEPQAGRFAWPPRYDEFITRAAKLGLAPLIVLDYSNGKAYPNEFHETKNGFPETPETRRLFVRYARACVERYGDRVTTWELWNEPQQWGKASPATYAELLKEVYPAVKSVRPDLTLIGCGGGGAGGGPGGDYVLGVIAAGGLPFMDGFSIHPYISPPDSYDLGYVAVGAPIPCVSIPVVWPYLAQLIADNRKAGGARLSLWVTEFGFYTSPIKLLEPAAAELMQGAVMTRAFLLSRRFTTARAAFWYDFQDDGTRPENFEENFGIIRADFTPKPAFVAMANLTAALGARTWTKSLIETDEVKALQFGSGEDAVIAAWTTQPKPQKVALPLPTGRYQIRDWQGRTRREYSRDGALPLTLDAQPQYVVQN